MAYQGGYGQYGGQYYSPEMLRLSGSTTGQGLTFNPGMVGVGSLGSAFTPTPQALAAQAQAEAQAQVHAQGLQQPGMGLPGIQPALVPPGIAQPLPISLSQAHSLGYLPGVDPVYTTGR